MKMLAKAKDKGPMVPPEYAVFFMTMAAVGATLFGLIFVVISIAPESIATTSAPLERQVRASTAYIALINPLIISLYALVPHQQIGTVVLVLGLTGIINTAIMALTILHQTVEWGARVRNISFILLGFLIYGYETYYAVRLFQSTTDRSVLNALADLLIIISIFGVARAWELVGIRQFRVQDWFASLRASQRTHALHTNAVTDSENDEK
jgi:hypothetical protein